MYRSQMYSLGSFDEYIHLCNQFIVLTVIEHFYKPRKPPLHLSGCPPQLTEPTSMIISNNHFMIYIFHVAVLCSLVVLRGVLLCEYTITGFSMVLLRYIWAFPVISALATLCLVTYSSIMFLLEPLG